jgi:hypothetical protein
MITEQYFLANTEYYLQITAAGTSLRALTRKLRQLKLVRPQQHDIYVSK